MIFNIPPRNVPVFQARLRLHEVREWRLSPIVIEEEDGHELRYTSMNSSQLAFIGIAVGAALCSPLGGLVAILVQPSSLLLSLSVGFAGGVLLGAVAFEMLPEALRLASMLPTVVGFVCGVASVWAFDLYVNQGVTAGDEADQKRFAHRYHRRHKPKGGKVTVIAGATTAEEMLEGIVIGVSGIVGGGTGIVVGLAIAINNLSEAMSIGELVRDEHKDEEGKFQASTMMWTSLIGGTLLVSALGGYFLLGSLPGLWQGILTAVGAGAMFYVASTGLVPEADSHQFQQSGGLATAAGLATMLIITHIG